MATYAESEVVRLKLDIENVQSLIASKEEFLANPPEGTTQARLNLSRATLQRLQTSLADYQAQLVQAEAAVAQQKTPNLQPEPPATASQTASDDAPKGPNKPGTLEVNSNGRISTPSASSAPTNATPPATDENTAGETTGTDAPTRTIEQTQATGPDSDSGEALSAPGYDQGEFQGYDEAVAAQASVDTEPGVGAVDDDGVTSSTSNSQNEVNAANNSTIKVVAQPNILDQYASYTYSASVYLITPQQYTRLINSKNRKIDGYQLLFQSGGAPNNTGGARNNDSATATQYGAFGEAPTGAAPADAGRNPFFPNDYYIDAITIETQPMGKGTGAAHMTATLKFTVVEPNGITLLDNLYAAVQNQAPKDAVGAINYTSAVYLIAIRFYGYDAEGNIQYPIRGGLETAQATSDSKAVVEKFIPFQIKSINWSVGTKLVSYEWECVPIGHLQGGYTARGTIPYDVQLVDSTVGGLLGGDAKYNEGATSSADPGKSTTTNSNGRANASTDPRVAGNASAPAKATAAPTTKKTITQGLMGAMNQFQQDLVKQGIYTVADEYYIEFKDGVGMKATDISGAKLQLPNTKVDKSKAPAAKSAEENPQALSQEKQSVDMISRSFSITAGQQILQAIELAIRNSEYISKQSLVTVNPDGTQTYNPPTTQPVKWFTITMAAEPLEYDPARNDNAYKITYTVAPFTPKNFNSKYFPVSKFSGVHKSYPFWFTGQNIAVKEYQENLNSLYTLTVSGNDPKDSAAKKIAASYTSSMLDIPKYNYSPASNASRQGADGKSLEASANAAEVLYNPSDLAEAKVKIIGDPAWIMQGSMFKAVTDDTFSGNSARTGFEPDGTISFDSQDILFEMVWQRPEDYDLGTGLADPYSGGYSGNPNKKRQALQSRVYIATKVVSEFRGGAFEQQLTGSLYLFPKPDKSNAANAAAATSGGVGADAGNQDGRSTNRPAPNITDAVAKRSGVNLSAAAAQQARSDFAKRDPRLITNPDSQTAAQVGSNQGKVAPSLETNAGGAAFGNPNIARQAAARAARLEAAGAASPPTDGTGTTVSATSTVAEEIGNGPPKLPNTGRPPTPGSLRDIQRQNLLAQQNASSANPNSTTNPGKQPMVKEE